MVWLDSFVRDGIGSQSTAHKFLEIGYDGEMVNKYKIEYQLFYFPFTTPQEYRFFTEVSRIQPSKVNIHKIVNACSSVHTKLDASVLKSKR
jgi:hypothetical protein